MMLSEWNLSSESIDVRKYIMNGVNTSQQRKTSTLPSIKSTIFK